MWSLQVMVELDKFAVDTLYLVGMMADSAVVRS